jgi:aspartate-semialdehyde dehydrogenase
MSSKIPVAVLGATGSVGQRFISLLDNHPMFEVVALAASDRSAGQAYGKACRWILTEPMPEWARDMIVVQPKPDQCNAKIAFSALPADQAKETEPEFARAGVAICSNASSYRTEPDVPILFPEINAEQVYVVKEQRKRRGWSGCIITNSNCTSAGLSVALKALQDAFGVRRGVVVSMQAISGAGYPGVPSLDITDNVIPYIGGNEEEKVEREPRKILGKLAGGEIQPADFVLSAHTNRVHVTDGHTVCASVELGTPATPEQAVEVMRAYQAPLAARDLPSAPDPVIVVRDEIDRPQPRLDRMTGRGMATVVGRVRPDPIFHLRFVVLSHNTIRGAAGGSLYNAELLVKEGLL